MEPVSNLDQLLPSADIVVLTIPLTSGNASSVRSKAPGQDEARALLVNAPRGPIIETEALLQALNEK